MREGEVFGLLGPNGTAKTTAVHCMTTLLPVPGRHGRRLRSRRRERPYGRTAPAGLRPAAAVRRRGPHRPRERRPVRPRLRRAPPRTRRPRRPGSDRGRPHRRRRPARRTYSGGMVRRLELALPPATRRLG
ncbi:hypothetical protein [Streptomyces sp. T12]|uniref:hypothetical protein n=1 Tax=Streptomyces sp. T12 TaxID=477697 RepID=UPI0035A3C6F0